MAAMPDGDRVQAELAHHILSLAHQDDGEIGMEPVPAVLRKLAPGARPVVLRDTESADDGPIVKPGGVDAPEEQESLGRLEVIGEIARGGMGVIYKARDTVIGRDVALKTVRKAHAFNTALRDRFIEEAQICGQLHHPGIVPVYEMGLLDDGRPYFLMKLLNGQTLASLLKAHRDPLAKRRRFLEIFDRLCQAVAYAHARGVIHRDLKPSNILIGGFGETQVMDWGLAKVVPRGGIADDFPVQTVRTGSELMDSLSGSVLGTAPYMAPEQAQGRVAEVDERTDVFSLGAILLEILTGQPPYVGKSREEVLDRAAAADLAGARERLQACAADAELLSLVSACLSPEREDRPADAGVVSEAMSAYLSSVEERAHRAELRAVEERTSAVAARRSKRLGLALAGTAVLAVVSGAGTFLWFEKQRRDSVEATAHTISNTLERARLFRDSALAAPSIDLDTWSRAVAAARDAEALAADAAVDPDLLSVARELAADLEERRMRAAREKDLARRLQDIRPDPYDDSDALRAEAEYTSAFAAHGLDVAVLEPADLAERIRGSPIAESLASALDEWVFVRRNVRADDDPSWKTLMEVALLADPDPWRTLLRNAWASDDREGLRRLAAMPEVAEASPRTLGLLARSLFAVGDSETALAVYRAAQLRHPDDYRLSHDLANLLSRLPPVPWDEVARLLAVAVSNRPTSGHACMDLAFVFAKQGDAVRAKTMLEQARRVDPDYRDLDDRTMRTLLVLGEDAAARELLERVLRTEPDHGFFALGVQFHEHKRPALAALAFERAIEQDPERAEAWCNFGLALLKLGRFEEALGPLRRGHELGSKRSNWTNPSGEWIEQAERSIVLDAQLTRFRSGEGPPEGTSERQALADFASSRGLHLTAGEILDSPDLCGHCAAREMLHALELGVDDHGERLDEPSRAKWRDRARRCLQQSLDSLASLRPPEFRATLQRWQQDACYDSVRADALDALPPDERAAWEALWAQVDRLVAGA